MGNREGIDQKIILKIKNEKEVGMIYILLMRLLILYVCSLTKENEKTFKGSYLLSEQAYIHRSL